MMPGPALNEIAPDFTLKTPDGKSELTLSAVAGPKPVVLVFGNYTCRPFRGQGGNLEKLYARFKDRANFLAVYVEKRIPLTAGGWKSTTCSASPSDSPGRTPNVPKLAMCAKALGLSFPVLVDTLDDTVNKAYCGIPSRLYLIDTQRRIAYKSGRGPFGFKPAELEQSMIMLLAQNAKRDGAAGRP